MDAPRTEDPSASTLDDAALLARLRAGDDAAFAEVVRRFGPRMRAAARRLLGKDDEADDVLQEAFLSAFAHLCDFEGGARLGTWLHRILLNAAFMRLRVRSRERRESVDDLLPAFAANGGFLASQPAFDPPPEETTERQDLLAHVRSKIALLPEPHRVPLVLQHVEGLSNDGVAFALGISVNAAKIRLHRARQALRALLEPRLAGRAG